jgi:hypothetical protein
MGSRFGSRFTVRTVATIVVFIALIRLGASHSMGLPGNFSPMNSAALLSGAVLSGTSMALALPLGLLIATDFVVNLLVYGSASPFYPGFYWQYLAYAAIVVLGKALLKGELRFARTLYCATAASAVFFFITNFGVWASSDLYPKSAAGLAACFTAGLPFLKGTLASDLAFSAILFGLLTLSAHERRGNAAGIPAANSR